MMVPGWITRAASLAAVIVPFTPHSGWAITQQGQQMMHNWAQSDRCVAAANKQYPDYTPDSLAKRDQAVQLCLSNSVLPPRAPLAPDATQK